MIRLTHSVKTLLLVILFGSSVGHAAIVTTTVTGDVPFNDSDNALGFGTSGTIPVTVTFSFNTTAPEVIGDGDPGTGGYDALTTATAVLGGVHTIEYVFGTDPAIDTQFSLANQPGDLILILTFDLFYSATFTSGPLAGSTWGDGTFAIVFEGPAGTLSSDSLAPIPINGWTMGQIQIAGSVDYAGSGINICCSTVFTSIESMFELDETTYQYIGNTFETINDDVIPAGSYDNTMRVTGSFTVPYPLDEGLIDIGPLITNYAFNDGRTTLTEHNSSLSGANNVIIDENGDILGWTFSIFEGIFEFEGEGEGDQAFLISTTGFDGEGGDSAAISECVVFTTQCDQSGTDSAYTGGLAGDPSGFWSVLPTPNLVASYPLTSSFSDELGGPDLVPDGPGILGADGYEVTGHGTGLSLNGVLSPNNYSVEMVFRLDGKADPADCNWAYGDCSHKVLDFKGRTADDGIYVVSRDGDQARGGLQFHPYFIGSEGAFQFGTLHHMVVTRSGATDEVAVYIDGVLLFSVADPGGYGIFSETSGIAHFLSDDLVFESDPPIGFIDQIQIYDAPLSASAVADLVPDTDGDGEPDFRDNCPTVPNPDQTDSNNDGDGDACGIYTVLFSGAVTSVSGEAFGAPSLGESINGMLSYDFDSVPTLFPSNPAVARYDDAGLLVIEIEQLSWVSDPATLTIRNDSDGLGQICSAGTCRDQFQANSVSPSNIAGDTFGESGEFIATFLSISLFDDETFPTVPTIFDDLSLPTSFALADFDAARVGLTFQTLETVRRTVIIGGQLNFIQIFPDPDSDGVPQDVDNCPTAPNTDQTDFDNDGQGDACDDDDDGDGISDSDEADLGTDPLRADTDGDGLSDGQEVFDFGTNPLDSDTDDDGLSDGDEVNNYGTDPFIFDTDGDGIEDGREVLLGSDPTSGDTDLDGYPDSFDNCISIPNFDQANADGDALGDICDPDFAGPVVVIFEDTFEPAESPLWKPFTGDWAASAGVYDTTSGFGGYSYLPLTLTDFAVEIDINQLQDGGIWLRSAPNVDGQLGAFGVLLITGGLGGGGEGLYWHIDDGAGLNPILGLNEPLYLNGTDTHLRIEVRSNMFSAFVNGSQTPATVLQLNAVQATFFTSGFVGLYDASETQNFDNLRIETLPVKPLDLGTVYFEDFDGGASQAPGVVATYSEVPVLESVRGYAGLGNGGNVFGGDFLRNSSGGDPAGGIGVPGDPTSITLTGLPLHTGVDLNFLFAEISTWDGGIPDPGCPVCAPDLLEIKVDGQVVFSESFGFHEPSFRPAVGTISLAELTNLGFSDWDSAYDMNFVGQLSDIQHTADTLNIEWRATGAGWQGGEDESWAIDNIEVSLTDRDSDFDTVRDALDNCPALPNADQADINGDGYGDACVDPSVIIPPSANVDPTAMVGASTVINKNVSVGPGASVGSNVILNKNVGVGQNAIIESGVTLNQGVIIGPRVFIGANSAIGRDSVFCAESGVGADSVVGKNNFVTVMWPADTLLGGVAGSAPNPGDCP